jgi:methyl-accepting chemotaxis protein
VVFSFDRQKNAQNPYHKVSGGSYEYFEGMGLPDLISEVKKVDDKTVQFVLTRPEAPFLADLAMDFASILSKEYADNMLKAGTPEKVDLNPIGTGPFQLLQYQKDSRILYKAFEGYWGTKPQIDRLVFSITPDASVRYAKLQKNECQVMPMNRLIDSIRHIASGDLVKRIDVEGTNEMGQLAETLRHMQGELVRTVGDVRNGANAIYSGASEISMGNNDLSSRTEQQAASLEETAASMEELTATVKQNAENARQASHLALSASETAQKGGKVVDNVVQTMRDIAGSSQKIADIISVIDGIAFQTNILALNAAVEAARAGEQGRGFAVVAGEVRNLAQRSAQAAREIKSLIEDSVSRVDLGSTLVESAGETMGEIVNAVTRVTDIMGEIASASDEQSRGIDQVGLAVAEMDRVTQQNASLVEESAAAAAALEEQASRLTQAVAVFRIQQEQQKARASATLKPVITPAMSRKTAAADSGDNWETF